MNTLPESYYSLTRFRVRYAETDAMGFVHHSAYFPWFEMGRADLSRKMGFSYAEIEKSGYYFPLTEAHCAFRNPAYYDDELVVKTWLRSVRSRTLIFEYEVRRLADDQVLATGATKHVVINHAKKIAKLPDDLLRMYTTIDVDLLPPA